MPGLFASALNHSCVSVGLHPYRGLVNITCKRSEDTTFGTPVSADELLSRFSQFHIDHEKDEMERLRVVRAEAYERIADW